MMNRRNGFVDYLNNKYLPDPQAFMLWNKIIMPFLQVLRHLLFEFLMPKMN